MSEHWTHCQDCHAALPPVRSEPLFSVDRFRSVLVKHGLVHEAAIDDPEGYDGYRTIEASLSAYNDLTENAALTGGEAVRSDDLLERLARWIVQHPPQYGGDHACAKCYPHSDILKDGFVCAFHEAERIVSSSNAALTGGNVPSNGVVGGVR